MRSTQLTAYQLINDNVFEWSVALIVLNEDSLYYGGYFKAKMTFPRNYPHSPPGTSQATLSRRGLLLGEEAV
jgi:ubiquitin-protein ligase